MIDDLPIPIDDELELDDTELPDDNTLYEKSLSIIKTAMKDVKQEILIKLEDGTDHIVYVTEIQISGSSVSYGFCTPSEDRRSELAPHVEKVLQLQLSDLMRNPKSKTFSF